MTIPLSRKSELPYTYCILTSNNEYHKSFRLKTKYKSSIFALQTLTLMKKIIYPILLIIYLVSFSNKIQAQIKYRALNVNNIKAFIHPQNLQFNNHSSGLPHFEYLYPADSLTTTICSYGLWLGGLDNNEQLHIAAEKSIQNGSDFWAGPLSVDGLASTNNLNNANWSRVWKIGKNDIIEHLNNYQNVNYQISDAIRTWPAHGDPALNQATYLAPFVDVDGDLIYNPELGDYPLIKGDQAIYFIYNDQLVHYGSNGLKLGVEVQCMAWAYGLSTNIDAYSNTIFFSYKIINRSQKTYFDTYFGVFADLDIGNATDDYIGSHVNNGNYYAYNGDDYDEQNNTTVGYGDNIPTQSVCILGGPYMDYDELDNPLGECNESVNGTGFGDGIVDNERYGMNRFVYFNSGGQTFQSDPTIAPSYYNYLQSIWKDNTSMTWGGNGHLSSGGTDTFHPRFMFPNSSDPCNWGTNGIDPDMGLWTEEAAGNDPNDRKGLASMGPFTFEAGSVHYLDIALVTAPGNADNNSRDLTQDYIEQIKQDYLVNPNNFGNQYVGLNEELDTSEQLIVYPNPANGSIIYFEISNPDKVEYFIYSSTGQIIENGQLPIQKQQRINIEHIEAGWYILEVRSGSQTLRSKLIL